MVMQITHVASHRRDEWNALVADDPAFALLQSWEWGEFKQRLGWKAFRIAAENDGRMIAAAQLLIKAAPGRVASVAYIPRGPVGEWTDDRVALPLLDEIHRVARRHRAVFLRIEPSALDGSSAAPRLRSLGFRDSPATNQPRATTIVDLSADLDAVLARMHHKTRYNIRLAGRNGVAVRTGDASDLATAHRLLRITGRRGGFDARSRRYYEQELEAFAEYGSYRFLVATYEDEPLAINISAAFGPRAAYIHGASSDQHRELMPNYLLMWEAMRWAKERGCTSFDLWGIPDEVGKLAAAHEPLPVSDRTDGLWGVYRFKRGFNGDVAYYAAAHDFAYSRPLYALMHRVMVAKGAPEHPTPVVRPVPA
jgi:lipid II:glycine glycyltransferase (peptidoglycan interpeptide bridge formation enzyme)